MDWPDGDAHQVAESLCLEFRGETGGKGRVEEKRRMKGNAMRNTERRCEQRGEFAVICLHTDIT